MYHYQKSYNTSHLALIRISSQAVASSQCSIISLPIWAVRRRPRVGARGRRPPQPRGGAVCDDACAARASASPSQVTVTRQRPFWRRRSITLRPAFVLFRLKKPCVRRRFSRLGCHVRLGIAMTVVSASCSAGGGVRTTRCTVAGGRSNSSAISAGASGRMRTSGQQTSETKRGVQEIMHSSRKRGWKGRRRVSHRTASERRDPASTHSPPHRGTSPSQPRRAAPRCCASALAARARWGAC